MNRGLFLVLVVAALSMVSADGVSSAVAQCSTCGDSYVAYQPAVQAATIQPTIAYQPYTGWYPGKLLDRLRLSRWTGALQTAPAYTAAYPTTYAAAAPVGYSAGYGAAYAPAPVAQTSYFTPYVSAYAPLQRTATVFRPVVLRPVAALLPVAAPSCDPCGGASYEPTNYAQPAAYYDQQSAAGYAQPASGCSSCGDVFTTPNYGPNYGPPTGQPSLADPPASSQSGYAPEGAPSQSQGAAADSSGTGSDSLDNEAPPVDPQPEPEIPAGDGSTYYDYNKPLQAPQLLPPTNDRTASKPTVDVWNAVYRKPIGRSAPINQTTARPTSTTRHPARPQTQVERDAEGWVAVPRNR